MHISYRTSIVILAIIFSPLWLPLALRIVFYVDTSGRYVAEQIVLNRRPVSHCNRILVMPWNVLSPGTNDQRRTCIHEYAKLMKDPSACELLMPSSYGMSCLGGAIDHRLCIIGEGAEDTVRGQGKITTYSECVSGDAEIQNYQCCVMARILREKNEFNKCSGLKTTELQDECHYFQAQHLMEVKECAFIVSDRMKTACSIAVKALEQK